MPGTTLDQHPELAEKGHTMRRPKGLPPVLRMFLLGTVLLGVLWGLSEFSCIHLLGFDRFPYNRMILPREDNFLDYVLFNNRLPHFHSRVFFDSDLGSPFLYPAPVGVLYAMVHLLTDQIHRYPFTAFTLLLVPLCCGLAVLLAFGLQRSGLSTKAAASFALLSLVTSYPIYFELNRSNMEIFVWLLTGGGVWAFLRNRPWLAAALIGLAGSCKLYPYILLGLLLLRKRYLQVLLGLFVGGLSTIASLWAMTGDILFTARQVAGGLRTFQKEYVLTRRSTEIGLDHSIFGFLKRPLTQMPPLPVAAHYLALYMLVVAVAGTALFFLRARKMPVSNQITFLTVATILLPPVSYDYTLLQLYTPWAVLVFLAVQGWRRGIVPTRGLQYAFVCFCFLLSPQNEVVWHEVKVEGQIKCIALIVLALISLWKPFESDASPSLSLKETSHENVFPSASPVLSSYPAFCTGQ